MRSFLSIVPSTDASPRGSIAAAMEAALLLCACAEEPAVPAIPGDAERGAALIGAYGCGACHVIPGIANAEAKVGPSLEDWAERSLIAGKLRNRPAVLVRWLVDPPAMIPGTGMPDQGVTPEEAVHMAAYLYSLGEPPDYGWTQDAPTGRNWYEAPYEPDG